jgi:hypothetical protein
MLIAFNKEEFLIKKKKVNEGERERCVKHSIQQKPLFFHLAA